MKRPNVLMILTDQQRADWLGCYGHSVLRTPNIDALAARGVRFTNFNVATPVCMPNRASIFTGRYPSVHGLRYNGLSLPVAETTFVDVLRDAGYATALIGKSHIQPMTDREPRVGKKPRFNHSYPEARKSDGARYDLEEPHHYDGTGRFDIPKPFYGFDHVDMVTLHGDQCSGHYLQWLRSQRSDWAELRDRRNQLPHSYKCPQAWRTPLPEDLYPTAYVRDRAIEYLRQTSDKPRFTFVSFADPHHPFTPPGKYWDMYTPDQFDVSVPFSAHRNPPPHLAACDAQLREGTRTTHEQMAFMASPDELKEAMALTAGMIAMIDDAVGELVSALGETGELDNTVVVFSADHGDYMGDLNLLLKGPNPRRSINRVPYIWADPLRPQVAVRDDLCSSLDIAPTLLNRCGCDAYYGVQGLDLFSGNRRDELLIEHEDNKPTPGFETKANVRTLLTESHRMSIYRGESWGELYDLRRDPNETYNLWDDASASQCKSELLARLANAMIAAVDPAPWPKRLA